MASKKKPHKWPGMEVAIAGEGLSPADVTVRQLAELLQATASAVEAVAEAHGLEPPDLRLTDVHEGSAAYELTTPSPEAPKIIREFYRAAKTRARNEPSKVKHALARLHHASKLGSIRIEPRDPKGSLRTKPIILAPPIEETSREIEACTEAQARVVGVLAGRGDSATVRLRLDRGGTEDFAADQPVAEAAARLFKRKVVARVTYVLGQDTKEAGRIERVEPWEDVDLLDVLRQVREQAASEGVAIDIEEWLAELDAAATE